MNYNNTAVIHNVTGSGETIVARISSPSDFLIKKLWLVVEVQGAEETRRVRITTAGAAATIAELSPGTAAVGTVFSASIDEDKRAYVGGTVLELRTIVADASAIYDVYCLIAHAE